MTPDFRAIARAHWPGSAAAEHAEPILRQMYEAGRESLWLPIEDAPKEWRDGRELFAYRRKGNAYWVVCWSDLRASWWLPGTNTRVNPDFLMLAEPPKEAQP